MEKKYHMIEDKDTNIVYLSHYLREEHPAFFSDFTCLLDRIEIEWGILPKSNDYWCRDFMPVQLSDNIFLKYWYHPSYLLEKKKYKKTITDSSHVCDAMGISTLKSQIIIDGGNVVPCGDRIVMTTRVFSENGVSDFDTKFTIKLQKFFQHDIIFIPWHQEPGATLENGGDVFGHADGIIKYCGDNRILMYFDGSKDAEDTVRILEEDGYEIIKMQFSGNGHEKQTWAYINFLQVGDKIVMPMFGILEDNVAKDIVQKAFPYCEVYQQGMYGIQKEGGALHCLSWNIKKIDADA